MVTAFATQHTVPSVGYIVWDRRHKLKQEYQGLPGEQIRDLRPAVFHIAAIIGKVGCDGILLQRLLEISG